MTNRLLLILVTLILCMFVPVYGQTPHGVAVVAMSNFASSDRDYDAEFVNDALRSRRLPAASLKELLN